MILRGLELELSSSAPRLCQVSYLLWGLMQERIMTRPYSSGELPRTDSHVGPSGFAAAPEACGGCGGCPTGLGWLRWPTQRPVVAVVAAPEAFGGCGGCLVGPNRAPSAADERLWRRCPLARAHGPRRRRPF